MGRRLFRSGFDLNRSSFQLSRYGGYYAQTRLLGPIFSLPVTLTFDLYTPNLLRRLPVSRLYQSTKFSVSAALRFPVNRRHGTDWQTRETLMQFSREGRINLVSTFNCNLKVVFVQQIFRLLAIEDLQKVFVGVITSSLFEVFMVIPVQRIQSKSLCDFINLSLQLYMRFLCKRHKYQLIQRS